MCCRYVIYYSLLSHIHYICYEIIQTYNCHIYIFLRFRMLTYSLYANCYISNSSFNQSINRKCFICGHNIISNGPDKLLILLLAFYVICNGYLIYILLSIKLTTFIHYIYIYHFQNSAYFSIVLKIKTSELNTVCHNLICN